MHQYINLALPQPNGARLNDKPTSQALSSKAKYFNADAKEAFQLLENKRFKDVDLANAKENDRKIRTNLVQINIESILARYTDNFQPFYNRLVAEDRTFFAMTDEDTKKLKELKGVGLPKDGWLVEIRGYTYHKEQLKFVEETFVENLQRFGEADILPDNLAVLNKPFQPGSSDTLRKLMMDRIEKNKALLFIYKVDVKDNPTPGVFGLINETKLDELLRPETVAAGKGAPPAGAGPAGAKERSGWKQLGVTRLGNAAGAATPQGADAAPRTEFIIYFIWREPFLAPEPPPAVTPGAPPPAGGAPPPPGGKK